MEYNPLKNVMKILITGATGFIGAALCLEFLRRGHDVGALGRTHEKLERLKARAVDLSGHLEIVQEDICSIQTLPNDVNTIIHAAGLFYSRALSNPAQTIKVNVGGTARLVTLARNYRTRSFVFLSSQMVYGNSLPPWSEEQCPIPSNVYGFSKYASEEIIWGAREEMDVVVLRLSRVYGVGLFMRWEELVGTFVQRAKVGKPLEVHGDGSQRVDLVHLRDVVHCVALIIESQNQTVWNNTFNVGGGGSISIREIAEAVAEIAKINGFPGVQIHMRHDLVPTSPSHLELNIDRIYKTLGWLPTMTLREGIHQYFSEIVPT